MRLNGLSVAMGLAVGLLMALAGCTSISPRTNVTVGYYNVKGTSFQELDRQIALHGPVVPGVGKAIAATRVRMVPDIRFGMIDGQCRVLRAKVRVQANVTLPKLSDRAAAERELRKAFNNIENYARLHEAVHVAIADGYAEEAETLLMAIRPTAECNTLRDRIQTAFDRVMQEHEAAQQKFDADEQARFAKLAREGSQVRQKPEAG